MIYKKQRGVTLIEMIIAVAVLGIVAMMATMGVKMINLFGRQRNIMEVETEAQRAMYFMERDIRNSYSYNIDWFNPARRDWGGNKLILILPGQIDDFDKNLGAILNTTTTTICYQFMNENGKTRLARRQGRRNDVEVSTMSFLVDALDVEDRIFFETDIYVGIDIKLTLAPLYWKGNNKKIYSTSILKYFNFKEIGS